MHQIMALQKTHTIDLTALTE